jgi:hypothetical protein
MSGDEHNPGEPEFGEHSEDAPHNPGEPQFGDEESTDPADTGTEEQAADADRPS